MIMIKGMLASAATVSLIAKLLRDYKITKSVVDPVHHLFQPTVLQHLTYMHRIGDGLDQRLAASTRRCNEDTDQ